MRMHLEEYLPEHVRLAVIAGYKRMDLELKSFPYLKMLEAER